MASIRSYRTSRGERRHEVRYRDHEGRDRSRAFSVLKDARAYKVELERMEQTGGVYQTTAERFGDVARGWLERYRIGAAGRVRPRARSIALAEENLACLSPLADVAVDKLRRPPVEDLVASLAARAPRRAEMTLALLKRILKDAEERGQVVDPAVFRIRIGRAEEREPRFLTWEEVDEVRSWMPEFVGRVVPVAVLTLLRRGEILALRDRDIDFERGSISITSQNQDGRRVTTKTRAGRRSVDVGPRALRLLREQQLARAPNDEGHLFPTSGGKLFDPHIFMSRYFKPAARAAGAPELTFHDLRHTGASLMIAAGCHVKVIAEQMGHADGGGLVLRRYGHLYKGAHRQAAAALESHIFDAPRDPSVGSAWGELQEGRDLE